MSQSGYAYADARDMKTTHIVFRREFGLLPDLIQSAAPGDEERAKIIADHIRLMSHALVHHHHAEDEVLWPLLLARAPKEVDPVVHVAEGHHQRLDDLLHRVEKAARSSSPSRRAPTSFRSRPGCTPTMPSACTGPAPRHAPPTLSSARPTSVPPPAPKRAPLARCGCLGNERPLPGCSGSHALLVRGSLSNASHAVEAAAANLPSASQEPGR
jgi:hypothetical protein